MGEAILRVPEVPDAIKQAHQREADGAADELSGHVARRRRGQLSRGLRGAAGSGKREDDQDQSRRRHDLGDEVRPADAVMGAERHGWLSKHDIANTVPACTP